MEAVVLAGGKGTRLRLLTADLPKPLVPIGKHPIIEILISRLAGSGVSRVHMAVNHLADKIEAVVGDGSRFGLKIIYSREDEPLSTIGPLTLLENLPGNFLIVNGDLLCDIDFSKFFEFHLSSGHHLTVATYQRKDVIDYGVLQVDSDGLVTEFAEKPVYQFTVSTGIYAMNKLLLDRIPRGRFGFDDLMRMMLAENLPIATVPHEGYWLDVGRPDDYDRALQDASLFERWLTAGK